MANHKINILIIFITISCFNEHPPQKHSNLIPVEKKDSLNISTTKQEDNIAQAFEIQTSKSEYSKDNTIITSEKSKIIEKKLIIFKENIIKDYNPEFFQNFVISYNNASDKQKEKIIEKIAEYTLIIIGKSQENLENQNTLINLTRFLTTHKNIGKKITETEIKIDNKKQKIGNTLSTCYFNDIQHQITEIGLPQDKLKKIQDMFKPIKTIGSNLYKSFLNTLNKIIPINKDTGAPIPYLTRTQRIISLISLCASFCLLRTMPIYVGSFVAAMVSINLIWKFINKRLPKNIYYIKSERLRLSIMAIDPTKIILDNLWRLIFEFRASEETKTELKEINKLEQGINSIKDCYKLNTNLSVFFRYVKGTLDQPIKNIHTIKKILSDIKLVKIRIRKFERYTEYPKNEEKFKESKTKIDGFIKQINQHVIKLNTPPESIDSNEKEYEDIDESLQKIISGTKKIIDDLDKLIENKNDFLKAVESNLKDIDQEIKLDSYLEFLRNNYTKLSDEKLGKIKNSIENIKISTENIAEFSKIYEEKDKFKKIGLSELLSFINTNVGEINNELKQLLNNISNISISRDYLIIDQQSKADTIKEKIQNCLNAITYCENIVDNIARVEKQIKDYNPKQGSDLTKFFANKHVTYLTKHSNKFLNDSKNKLKQIIKYTDIKPINQQLKDINNYIEKIHKNFTTFSEIAIKWEDINQVILKMDKLDKDIRKLLNEQNGNNLKQNIKQIFEKYAEEIKSIESDKKKFLDFGDVDYDIDFFSKKLYNINSDIKKAKDTILNLQKIELAIEWGDIFQDFVQQILEGISEANTLEGITFSECNELKESYLNTAKPDNRITLIKQLYNTTIKDIQQTIKDRELNEKLKIVLGNLDYNPSFDRAYHYKKASFFQSGLHANNLHFSPKSIDTIIYGLYELNSDILILNNPIKKSITEDLGKAMQNLRSKMTKFIFFNEEFDFENVSDFLNLKVGIKINQDNIKKYKEILPSVVHYLILCLLLDLDGINDEKEEEYESDTEEEDDE